MTKTKSLSSCLLNKKVCSVFASFVENLADLSKCKDRHVACIICDSDMKQIYSIGVNGGPSGIEDLECLCSSDKTKYSCIHAEANALIKLTTRVEHKIMICSLSPCLQCASMIINEPCGFYAVLFMNRHKDTEALRILIDANILVGQLSLNGEVMWLNKEDL